MAEIAARGGPNCSSEHNGASSSVSCKSSSAAMNGLCPSVECASSGASKTLHLVTPLLKSRRLSDKVGANVWLKLENVQNSGSFKIRGLGHLCTKVCSLGCRLLLL